MSRRAIRRVFTVLPLLCAVCLFSVAPAQAASRGGSNESGFAAGSELHGGSFWSLLMSLIQKAGARIDDNGIW